MLNEALIRVLFFAEQDACTCVAGRSHHSTERKHADNEDTYTYYNTVLALRCTRVCHIYKATEWIIKKNCIINIATKKRKRKKEEVIFWVLALS